MTKSKTAAKNADEFERLNSKRGEQMKYLGKPAGMWALFAGSFEKHLTVEFDLTAEQAKDVAARAKKNTARSSRSCRNLTSATASK